MYFFSLARKDRDLDGGCLPGTDKVERVRRGDAARVTWSRGNDQRAVDGPVHSACRGRGAWGGRSRRALERPEAKALSRRLSSV